MKSSFSARLQEAMDIRGMKQVDLTEKTKISKGTISQYLSGRFAAKQRNTYLVAEALNVNEAWLMGYDVPMERNSTTLHFEEIGASDSYKVHGEPSNEEKDYIVKLMENTESDSSLGQAIQGLIETHGKLSELDKARLIDGLAVINGMFDIKTGKTKNTKTKK